MRGQSLRMGIAVLAISASAGAATTQEFSSDAWSRSNSDSELVEHRGRSSLFLRSGLLWLPNAEFKNGVIEFDVSFTGERGFLGAAFRIEDEQNYEHVYLRPHQSGNPDSVQYTPVHNGLAAWQLYGQATAAIEFDSQDWIHVRLVVWEDTLQLSVDSETPQLSVRLGRTARSGGVGLIVGAGYASAHFSTFSVTPLVKAKPPELPAVAAAPGAIHTWSVSESFEESKLEGVLSLDSWGLDEFEWADLQADPGGLTNLAKRQGLRGKRNTCLARVRLESADKQLARFDFGFSDRARVYLNGQLLFAGNDTYRSRDYRFLGTIGDFDQLWLPLRAGSNELIVAVAESFGGWGVIGRVRGQDPNQPLRLVHVP